MYKIYLKVNKFPKNYRFHLIFGVLSAEIKFPK